MRGPGEEVERGRESAVWAMNSTSTRHDGSVVARSHVLGKVCSVLIIWADILFILHR